MRTYREHGIGLESKDKQFMCDMIEKEKPADRWRERGGMSKQ